MLLGEVAHPNLNTLMVSFPSGRIMLLSVECVTLIIVLKYQCD